MSVRLLGVSYAFGILCLWPLTINTTYFENIIEAEKNIFEEETKRFFCKKYNAHSMDHRDAHFQADRFG